MKRSVIWSAIILLSLPVICAFTLQGGHRALVALAKTSANACQSADAETQSESTLGCANQSSSKPAPAAAPSAEVAAQADFVTVPSQPTNVGDAKAAALSYHDSGAYNHDLATVAGEAGRWLARRVSAVTRPALVLDIDETALSNWDVIKLDDFGRPIEGPCAPESGGPCGWAAWDQLGRDPAIAPTLQVFRLAHTLNVTVFFITGRPESQREATERNLVAAGYGGYKRLYMVPDGAHFASAADLKTPIRVEIEQAGYNIVVNMGDQPSDLQGGHAEKMFMLPNPFYRVR
jgi:HAD superfamily, subfamily IIIB (Acid phosphatase)